MGNDSYGALCCWFGTVFIIIANAVSYSATSLFTCYDIVMPLFSTVAAVVSLVPRLGTSFGGGWSRRQINISFSSLVDLVY